jgi:hypothetical protein
VGLGGLDLARTTLLLLKVKAFQLGGREHLGELIARVTNRKAGRGVFGENTLAPAVYVQFDANAILSLQTISCTRQRAVQLVVKIDERGPQ